MSQQLLDAFKAAAETPGKDENGKDLYIAAVLNFINENAEELLVGEHGGLFAQIVPAGSGRHQAIAIGLKEIKDLFGDFTDFNELLAKLDHQIMVEHAKFDIIEKVRNAASDGEMRTALDLVATLNDHRQDLIEAWSQSDIPAVQARVAQLEAEEYTLVLKELAAHADNGIYFDLLAAKMMAGRDSIYGTGTLIPALKAADLAVNADVLAAFNEASDAAAALAAIEAYDALLLDDNHLDMLDDLDGYTGRQEAVGSGILGTKALFGPFETIDEIKQALEFQVETEHAKWELITQLDAAMTAAAMTEALYATIGAVNDDRQELIDFLLAQTDNPAALALAADLQASDYTTVLAEIATHLEDEDYMAELGARMLAARNAIEPDGKFYGDTKIIPALALADEQIAAEFDAEITGDITGAVAEDATQTVSGDLDITDGDWGEDVFRPASSEDLLKEYGTFSFDETSGEWSFTIDNEAAQSLAEGEEVEQTLTVVSADGTASKTITVTVTGANDAPVAAAEDNKAAGDEDTTITGQVPAGSDVDGDALTYVLVGDVDGLTFNPDGTFSYEPAEGFHGDVTFEYRVRDVHGALSEARTFTITVVPLNDPPEGAGGEITGDEDTTITDSVPAGTDPEGGPVTYKLVGEAIAGLTFNEDGSFSYEPAENFHGEVEFQYVVVDEAGAESEIQTFTITVAPVNDAPVASTTGNEISGEEGTTITGEVPAGSDVDDDDLTYELVGEVEGLTFGEDGSFSYVAPEGATGPVTFEYRVVDGNGGVSEPQTFTITVTPANEPPEAEPAQNVTTEEDTVITQDIGATDPNGDTLTYSVKSGSEPQKGKVTFAGGKFIYTPAKDVNGTDTFTIVISDGEHAIEQTVTVTINAVNDAPADITLSNSRVAENAIAGTAVGSLTATDLEGGAMKFALLDDAGGRFKLETKDGVTSLVVADGLKLDYEQAKFHTVRVQVTDSDNKTYEETLTIDLTDVAGERITGTTGTDVLVGGAGKDVFNGGLGNDKLAGGLGNDTLTGGKGKDIFVFDTKLGTSSTDRKVNFDSIKDFSVRDDSLYLDNAIFKKLGSGTAEKPKQLSKSFFTIGDSAKDRNDYIVYNNKTGVLSYDADGSGRGKAVEFAQLSKNLTTLSYKDFFVI